MFKQLGRDRDLSESSHISDEEITGGGKELLVAVHEIVEGSYPDAYLPPLFKNVRKCTDIYSKLFPP